MRRQLEEAAKRSPKEAEVVVVSSGAGEQPCQNCPKLETKITYKEAKIKELHDEVQLLQAELVSEHQRGQGGGGAQLATVARLLSIKRWRKGSPAPSAVAQGSSTVYCNTMCCVLGWHLYSYEIGGDKWTKTSLRIV